MYPRDYISRPEHDDLNRRTAKVESTVESLASRVDTVESKIDRFDGMFTLLRWTFGASVLGVITSAIAILEILRH